MQTIMIYSAQFLCSVLGSFKNGFCWPHKRKPNSWLLGNKCGHAGTGASVASEVCHDSWEGLFGEDMLAKVIYTLSK